jgi:hypothetical protein
LDYHDVSTAFELGWSTLENGDLLDAAEADGFEVLITTDQNIRYQQDLRARRIANSSSWVRRVGRESGVASGT